MKNTNLKVQTLSVGYTEFIVIIIAIEHLVGSEDTSKT